MHLPLARRADIIARHKILESVGGSGWHRKDAGSPHMLDQMPLSERPIGFVGDDEVLFVGEDVDTVKQGLAKFAARYEGQEIPEDAAQLIRTLKAVPGQIARRQHDGEYAIPRGKWNDINFALHDVGVICCITQLEEPRPCPTND